MDVVVLEVVLALQLYFVRTLGGFALFALDLQPCFVWSVCVSQRFGKQASNA
jgi:hypothetical protein